MPIKVHRPGAYKVEPRSEERIKLPLKLRSNPPPPKKSCKETIERELIEEITQPKKVRFT